MIDKIKEFKLSSWAIDNKISIYILTIIISIAGAISYNSLPKESFPDIVVPTIYINTVYAGNSPENIERLVTDPIETQLKSISGIKKITSTSLQDVSVIIAEFDSDKDPDKAKLLVKDKVELAKGNFKFTPTAGPIVADMNFSDRPIMYINVAGPYDLQVLNDYAEKIKDSVTSFAEISRVDIIGAPEREIQIDVDMFKMQALNITFYDVMGAIQGENSNITSGTISLNGQQQTVSLKNELRSVDELNKILVNGSGGAKKFLGEFAKVKDGIKEMQSYARLGGESVITLNIVKRPGQNLINASNKITELIKRLQLKKEIPSNVKIIPTGDQSEKTKTTLHDLINTIIIGFLLVTFILMFFMGVSNAIFVALSVPLSMCIAFMVMPGIHFTLNMIVLFAFLLALGIVVDDAIVVIENTHRIFKEGRGKRTIVQAAKIAAGEVFLPVLSGTLTTLAPFIPLAFWKGVIGKFMFFLPITLIITLLASLLVAYIINPVFAVDFMGHEEENTANKKIKLTKGNKVVSIIFLAIAAIGYTAGSFFAGNLVLFVLGFYLLNIFVLDRIIKNFQEKKWPLFQERYKKMLVWCLKRPYTMIYTTIALFVFTIVLMKIAPPKIVFFPQGEPNFIYIYAKLPVGTSPAVTNNMIQQVEKKVNGIIGDKNPIISSIITNVTKNVTDPADQDRSDYPNRAKIEIAFVNFADRQGKSTANYLKQLQQLKWNIPGAEIVVTKEQAGPPTQKPISIEISGDNFKDLTENGKNLMRYLNEKIKTDRVEGVSGLKMDFETGKPEIVWDIDTTRAQAESIKASQIGMEMRTAIFGMEVSKYRDLKDEYPIMLRYAETQRNDIEMLKSHKIVFRDMNMNGLLRSIPISTFAKIRYGETYGGIKRKNKKRVITISSDVNQGFNANEVASQVIALSTGFVPEGNVEINSAGQQQEQKETGAFLGNALLISLAIIFLILVTQFNSFSKPLIIITEIFFSLIGVLLFTTIFRMEMSIVMTGIGVVALAGIVVRNGILLVEFADVLRGRGMGLYEAIVEAGKTRMTPVLLTATAAILGLIPLAVGFNIDFYELISCGKPHIYFGGDSVAFWGPLSWTMIFGLSFATFLTLILVPAMYLISERLKKKSEIVFDFYNIPKFKFFMYIPFLVLILRGIALIKKHKFHWDNLDA